MSKITLPYVNLPKADNVRMQFSDGREIDMPKEVFRRMLSLARNRLVALKKSENAQFPEIDSTTLYLIEVIQSRYTDLM